MLKEKINKISAQKIIECLICLFLFLLPWQTRWIYFFSVLEYSTLSFYVTEFLLWIIIVLFVIWKFWDKRLWKKILTKEHFQNHKKYLILYFVFCILYFIVLFSSINFNVSLQWTVWWLGAMCFGVVMLLTQGVKQSKKEKYFQNTDRPFFIFSGSHQIFLFAFWIGGVLQGLIAIIQFFTQVIFANKWLGVAYHSGIDGGASVIDFAGGRFLRAYGSFGWPNSLGIYLAVCLIVGLIIYFKTKNYKIKILITAGQMFVLSGLILSFSRAAWLSVIIGIFVLFFTILKIFPSKIIFFFRQLFFYFLLFTFYFLLLFPLFTARLDLSNRLESRSVVERASQYFESTQIIKNDFWFGVGAGNYTLVLQEKYPNRESWEYQPVHNIYILALSELGLVGFLLYFGLVFFLLFFVGKYRPMSLAIIVVALTAGFFDHWVFSMYTGMVLFWLTLFIGFTDDNLYKN